MPEHDPEQTIDSHDAPTEPQEHYVVETIEGSQESFPTSIDKFPPDFQETLSHQSATTSLRPENQIKLPEETVSVARRKVEHPTSTTVDSNQVDYKLLDLLGEGGMGQVHLARQTGLDRDVAIKRLHANKQATAHHREFLAEAIVTGRLEHPHIVPIYDVGQTESGELFYSMKNVQGQPWSEMLDQRPVLENLEILIDVCNAIAFAHSQGIIHRDLKPSNIMIGGFGEVLVMDWGLALVMGSPAHTMASVAGTPAYMSPEMVNRPSSSDARSDVYLLGAILYQIVSGRPPHRGRTGRESLLAASRNEITVCPAQRRESCDASGELLEIALRAMKADPDHRFTSVLEFQASLRGYLRHRDSLELSTRANRILSEAATTGDYAKFSRAVFGFEEASELWEANEEASQGTEIARTKWAEVAENQGDYDLCLSLLDETTTDHTQWRDRVRLLKQERESRAETLQRVKRIAIAASLLITLSTIGVAFWINAERNKAVLAQRRESAERQRADNEAIAAKRNQEQAEDNLLIAQHNAYSADMLLAESAWKETNLPRMSSLLDRYRDRDDLKGAGWHYFNRQLEPSLQTKWIGNANEQNLTVSPDGRLVATTKKHGRVVILDSVTLDTIAEIPVSHGQMYSLRFSPDGKRLGVGSKDGHVVLIDVREEMVIQKWMAHIGGTFALRFTSDSKQLVTGGQDKRLRTWAVKTGKELKSLREHTSPVNVIDLSPDETMAVVGYKNGEVVIHDLDSNKIVRRFEGVRAEVRAAAWHPSLPYIAAGGLDASLFVWNVETGALKYPPMQDSFYVETVEFSPDGEYLAYGGYHDRVKIVEFQSGTEVRSFRGHLYSVREVRFDPAGRRLFSISGDKKIMTWDWRSASDRKILPGHQGVVVKILMTNDQKHLVTAGTDGVIVVREFESSQITSRFQAHSSSIEGLALISANKIMSVGRDRNLRIWDLAGELLHSFPLPDHCIYGLALLPDEKSVLLGNLKGTMILFDLVASRQTREFQIGDDWTGRIAITPDGSQLITGHEKAMLKRWDLKSGQPLSKYDGNDTAGDIYTLIISRDQRMIAAGGRDSTIRIWDLESGELLHTLKGQSLAVRSLAFTSDARQIASASMDGTVKLWDLSTGREEFVFPELDVPCSVFVHPDDRRFVAGDSKGTLHLLDTRTWDADQRTENLARSALLHWRELCDSNEQMLNEIDEDATLADAVKSRCQQWAELFWNGQAYDLALKLEESNVDTDWPGMLRDADRLKRIGSDNVLNLRKAAETYLECSVRMNRLEREPVVNLASQCLADAFQISSLEQYRSLIQSNIYKNLKEKRSERVALARLMTARRLRQDSPGDSEHIRQNAYGNYHLGRLHRSNREHLKAIPYFEKAMQQHASRIPANPKDSMPSAGVTLCGHYLALSYLAKGNYDQAIKTFEEIVSVCDQVIGQGINESEFKTRRGIYIADLEKARYRKRITSIEDQSEQLISERPDVLVDRAAEFVKSDQYNEALASLERFLELNLDDKTTQLIRAAGAYVAVGEQLTTANADEATSSQKRLAERAFQSAERCFREASELGWRCDDNQRNSPAITRLSTREGFMKSIDFDFAERPSTQPLWRTAMSSIDASEKKSYSQFEEQPNGDWLESGISRSSGKSFEARFEVVRETQHYIDIDKVGIDVRVRLWPDKAFLKRTTETNGRVGDWRMLYSGHWQ